MNSEMKNNIRSEMKEMKERLDTLTASLEENKDEGQLWETYEDEHKFTICHFQVSLCLCFKASLKAKPFFLK